MSLSPDKTSGLSVEIWDLVKIISHFHLPSEPVDWFKLSQDGEVGKENGV